ncbi:MAG: hypothetical protein WC080_01240 [Patescibacteria group bacterium]|jgi:hypothetical protein
MKNLSLMWRGVINAIGIAAYVVLVVLFLNNGEKIFGKMNSIIGSATFLMVFVLSALVVGILSVGKPLMLYFDGKKKEAISLLLYTVLFVAIITLIALFVIAVV